MKTRLLISTILFTIAITNLRAQQPLSLYYLENLPQSNMMNPAIMPRANFFFGMPGINSINLTYMGDIAFNDAIQKTGDGDWVTPMSNRYDYGKLYKTIGKSINNNVYANISPLFFGFRAKNNYFTFAITEKAMAETGLPSDFIKIGDVGFPDGSVYDFSTLRMRAIYYREYSVGYARTINKKLTVGIHAKHLYGLAAFTTDINQLKMSVGREQYEITASGNIYSSFPMDVTPNENGLPEDIEVKDLSSSEWRSRALSNYSNPGMAFDFGAQYQFNERISFSAALNNLGFIRWKKDLNSLSFNGTYNFKGLNANADNHDELDDAVDDIMDSLKTVIKYNTSHQKFSTSLSPFLYLGSSYKVNHYLTMGFLSRSAFYKYNFRQDFNLSANINCYRIFTFNLSLNQRIKGPGYAGMGVSWLMGPAQFYLLADHIPLRYSIIDDDGDKFPIPSRLKDVNIMTGINFVFGSKGLKNSPMIGK
jgi:hypothetical protein